MRIEIQTQNLLNSRITSQKGNNKQTKMQQKHKQPGRQRHILKLKQHRNIETEVAQTQCASSQRIEPNRYRHYHETESKLKCMAMSFKRQYLKIEKTDN
jgi:hypothetical protein